MKRKSIRKWIFSTILAKFRFSNDDDKLRSGTQRKEKTKKREREKQTQSNWEIKSNSYIRILLQHEAIQIHIPQMCAIQFSNK